MSDEHDATWGELKAEIRSLNFNVSRLTEVVDENTKQLSKVEVLENNHAHQNAALGRVFVEVKEVKETHKIFAEDQGKQNLEYSKYIWLVTGFVTAVCVFWTLIGYWVITQIDLTMRTVQEMRTHAAHDVIQTADDVRTVVDRINKEVR